MFSPKTIELKVRRIISGSVYGERVVRCVYQDAAVLHGSYPLQGGDINAAIELSEEEMAALSLIIKSASERYQKEIIAHLGGKTA